MSSVNKAIIIGNLGSNPEIKTFDNGDKIANISIATSEKWKDRNGDVQERTEWHRVSLRGKVVDVAEKYLNKGSKVYIEGKLQTRKYEQNGVEKYTTEIIAYNLTMLGGQSSSASQSSQAPPPPNDIDDSPF